MGVAMLKYNHQCADFSVNQGVIREKSFQNTFCKCSVHVSEILVFFFNGEIPGAPRETLYFRV